jgi:hypothetical protein
MLELILQSALLLAVIGAYEVRLRGLDARLRKAVSGAEVERLIDLKLEVVKAQHEDLKEDLRRIEVKVDLLLHGKL